METSKSVVMYADNGSRSSILDREVGQGASSSHQRILEAEQTFNDYLRLVDRGEAPSQGDFIDQQRVEIRPELRRMLECWSSIREKLGSQNLQYVEGQEIGDFVLVEELGAGAFGVVWKAIQVSLNRTVALKILKPEFGLTPVTLQRFRREAQASGRLAHPGIVQIHTNGEFEGIHYIAQEFVPGKLTLAGFIARRRIMAELPNGYYESVARLFAEVADAIQHAHEADIIHRDLKPANILMTAEGRPKVVDFGMAYVEGELGLSMTGERTGTPFYMSPEQAMAKRMGLDRRTDVFSLGATLFEALTLVRAFEGDTREQVFEKILLEETSDPRKLRSQVPRDLAIICLKAMQKKRKMRYQTMADLAADLRRFLNHEPILAKPPSILSRLAKWTVRHPVLATTTGLITSASIVIAMLWVANRHQVHRIELLSRYEGSGTAAHIQALIDKADKLPPAHPEIKQRLRDWLEDVEPYRELWAKHEQLLEEVREGATRILDPEVRSPHPRLEELKRAQDSLERLEQTRSFLVSHFRAGGNQPLLSPENLDLTKIQQDLEQRMAQTRAKVQQLEFVISGQPEFDFPSELEGIVHESLEKLVDLERELFDPDSGLVEGRSPKHGLGVAQRLESVERLEEKTITSKNATARWSEAIARIQEHDRYDGLTLEPQFGLLPIGPDRESGLWEFADLQTGRAAERDAESGELILTRECGLVFVLIPGGSFLMGSQAKDQQAPNYDPFSASGLSPHEVVLAPYFISKYEMSQAQWARVTGENPSHFFELSLEEGIIHTGNHPVEQVNWPEARRVMWRLGFSLPTEAQWEHAARGGTSTPWSTGADPESLIGAANLDLLYTGIRHGVGEGSPFPDNYSAHAPVYSFRANPFGLHHVHGNVQEWCQDDLVPYDLPTKEGDGRRSDLGLIYRVVRGGEFTQDPQECGSAERRGLRPHLRNPQTGVRPARAIRPLPSSISQWELRQEDNRPLHGTAIHSDASYLAIDGEVLVLGAPSGTREEINSDRVLILRRKGDTWISEASLQPAERLPSGADFGYSVALSGNTLLVGAPFDHGSSEWTGAVYVYIHEDGFWQFQCKLLASDEAPGDQFGFSVSVDGDYAIVGAVGAKHQVERAGAAYVFIRHEGRWIEQCKLSLDKPLPKQHFGRAVSISGSRALVTAAPSHARGSAHIFIREGEQWVEEAKLTDNFGSNPNGFGNSACLDGDTAVVSACTEDTAGVFAGAAYIYVYDQGCWDLQQKLVASDAKKEDRFGSHVSIRGDLVLVGAMWKNEFANKSGAAYLYLRRGDRWTEIAKLVGRDLGEEDHFGNKLALGENWAAVFGRKDLESSEPAYRNLIYVFDDLR